MTTRTGLPRHTQRPGVCTWCGHPHTSPCAEQIYLRDAHDPRDQTEAPCPCPRRTTR